MCLVQSVWPSDEVRTAVGIGLMFIQFFIPFMVLIFCYGKIVLVLTKRINTDLVENRSGMENSEKAHDFAANPKEVRDTNKDKFQLARRNTIKTLLIVGLCFIICWSQNQILYFMYNCGYSTNFNTPYFQSTILLVFLNCTVNPFIYLIKYRDYQIALKNFFHCTKGQKSPNSYNVPTISNANPPTA